MKRYFWYSYWGGLEKPFKESEVSYSDAMWAQRLIEAGEPDFLYDVVIMEDCING